VIPLILSFDFTVWFVFVFVAMLLCDFALSHKGVMVALQRQGALFHLLAYWGDHTRWIVLFIFNLQILLRFGGIRCLFKGKAFPLLSTVVLSSGSLAFRSNHSFTPLSPINECFSFLFPICFHSFERLHASLLVML